MATVQHEISGSVGYRLMALLCGCALLTAMFAPRDARAEDSMEKGYTYSFWPRNPQRVEQPTDYRYAVRTDQYGVLLNVHGARLERLGAIASSSAAAALHQTDVLETLAPVKLDWWMEVAGRRYRIVSGAWNPLAERNVIWQGLRLIDGGRWLQHFEIINVRFADEEGQPLEGLNASLRFACWPDCMVVTLHLNTTLDYDVVSGRRPLRIGIDLPVGQAQDTRWVQDSHPAEWRPAEPGMSQVVTGWAATNDESGGLAALFAADGDWSIAWSEDGQPCVARNLGAWAAFDPLSFTCVLVPRRSGVLAHSDRVRTEKGLGVRAQTAEGQPLPVSFSKTLWAHVVELPAQDDLWSEERTALALNHDLATTQQGRIIFQKDYDFHTNTNDRTTKNLIGFSAHLTDPETGGEPLGLPVQISKNWHVMRNWSRAIALLAAPPGDRSLELVRVNALWAGVPAISHAQLCLIGWGGNQLWEQVALGSFGEAICYDPSVNLQRSVVDDIRPAFVWGMSEEPQKWVWTTNVGGADFLVVETPESQADRRQFEQQMRELEAGDRRPGDRIYPTWRLLPDGQKTLYHKAGPVLSEVSYGGSYADGRIRSDVTTYSWRSDDFFRAVFHIRYDCLEAVEFERLAFFQLGADFYNDNLFTTMARGDEDGLTEQWSPPMGEAAGYSRRNEPVAGANPWFALMGTQPEDDRFPHAAWANRMLVVREWRARLGGRDDVPIHYAVYGTSNRTESAVLELSPPASLERLEPGDYVETWLEMSVLPQKAQDYYGENRALREQLMNYPDSWPLAHWVARSRPEIMVHEGHQQRSYLPLIRAEQDRAEWTMTAGHGWWPVTIDNLSRPGPYRLEVKGEGDWQVLEASSERQFIRQTDGNPANATWSLSYSFELPEGESRRYRLAPEDAASE
ncbi:MAG TPA: hypothetical protein PLG73_03395 [Candidatus Sumerlaeota bacterium]|nr:hypothetical protein [Candidatus Sumerlaeota bacterium]